MGFRRSILNLLLLCYFVYAAATVAVEEEAEEFHEELLLKPLPDRKVLAHFHFESKANLSPSNGGRHFRLFPKSIYQLVHKFHIREMELSFTQGRWNYEYWGGFDPISRNNARPPGVELWAIFDVPPSQVDALWKNLTHTLSGLFCASINFLESSTSYSAPEWGFRRSSDSLRYGTLPREAVCTENLTPWLKLLPCRDKAGLSELMDRPSIYRGFYHSQRLHLRSSEFSPMDLDSGIRLEQTLTIVLQPGSQRVGMSYNDEAITQPSWSMSSLFGRKVNGRCVLAKSSNVYLQLERGLVSELKNLWKENDGSRSDDVTNENFLTNSVFELSVSSDRLIREVVSLDNEESSVLYLFWIEKNADAKPFDLALIWKRPVIWSSSQAPLHANRFLMGSGNERGSIAVSLKPAEHVESYLATGLSDNECKLRVDVFQVVPWYVKVYYHTLQIFVDGQIQPIYNVIEKMRVSPSEDKVSPGVLELVLKFPCDMKSAALTLEFDKGFLHISEYPPDANQGFDIPSAVITFPDFQPNFHFDEDSNQSPMLSRLKEISPALAYTEVLLVPLTTPDFSMPYNVITITCTVFALYFGSLLNVLRRRIGEEERLLEDRAAKKVGPLRLLFLKLSTKLRGRPLERVHSPPSSSSSAATKLVFKVVLVAAIASAWQYYYK
ncbi:hypothetical protein Nepgr_032781 [Nepenthes gracilis]|uniref:GPI transamidase component PIG-T n=1 Tax=Nepenthes gracilis TaxID=150966 RepID=A0AAD3TL30_NEPGR|nr:hypothetical protein Nepgr_032781 [Nepenthes gracilis]